MSTDEERERVANQAHFSCDNRNSHISNGPFTVWKSFRLLCCLSEPEIALPQQPLHYLTYRLSLTSCKPVALCHYQLPFWPTGESSFGTGTCGFFANTKISLSKISTFTMGLMALNRYYKIVKPTKYLTIFNPRCMLSPHCWPGRYLLHLPFS